MESRFQLATELGNRPQVDLNFSIAVSASLMRSSGVYPIVNATGGKWSHSYPGLPRHLTSAASQCIWFISNQVPTSWLGGMWALRNSTNGPETSASNWRSQVAGSPF